MEPIYDASSLPEKDRRVSSVISVRTLPTVGRSAEVFRRWKSRTDGVRPTPRAETIRFADRIDVEVRVTVRPSSWHPTKHPLEATPGPILIVKDTKHVVRMLQGQTRPPGGASVPSLMPVAFRATPSRALLDALLDLTFDAVKPTRPPKSVEAAPDG